MTIIRKSTQAIKIFGQIAASKVRYWKYLKEYGDAAPKPYEIEYVDPAEIRYCTLPSLMTQYSLSEYGSHIVGGDWDRYPLYTDIWYTRDFDEPLRAKFENHALYRAMEAHFCDGVPWVDTDWFQWIQDHPGTVGQYPTQNVMQHRLEQVDALFNQIREGGYKTQRQLYNSEKNEIPLYKRPFPFPEHHEIDVNIGRDGDLLFNFNGRHRLAVAKLLDLNRIPVRIFGRHKIWQDQSETRNEPL